MSNLRTLALALLFLTAFQSTVQAQHREIAPEPTEAEVLASRPARATRVLAGVGLGVAGLVVATGIGIGVGAAMHEDCASRFLCFQNHALGGGLVGASVGVALLPALYTLAGEWTGGRGHAGGAYLGFLVGSAASAGMISLGALANDRLRNEAGSGLLGTSIALGILAPFVGMALGYEITDDATLPQVQPTVAFDTEGATFGLAGTF